MKFTQALFINRDLSVEVTGIKDEQVQESIYTQLRDVVTNGRRLNSLMEKPV